MLFYNDHAPEHFHVIGKGVEAKVTFADLQIIEVEGRLSHSDIRTIRRWAEHHRPELYENWLLARRHLPLRNVGS